MNLLEGWFKVRMRLGQFGSETRGISSKGTLLSFFLILLTQKEYKRFGQHILIWEGSEIHSISGTRRTKTKQNKKKHMQTHSCSTSSAGAAY